MAADDATMTLAHARARVSRDMWDAATRYCNATTGQERDTAERDYRAAEARLDALPGLIPPETLKAIYARWAAEDG